jgi:hypothetical protein
MSSTREYESYKMSTHLYNKENVRSRGDPYLKSHHALRESTEYISSANSSIIGTSALYTSRVPPSMKAGISSKCYNLNPSMNNSFARLPEIEEYGKPYERV